MIYFLSIIIIDESSFIHLMIINVIIIGFSFFGLFIHLFLLLDNSKYKQNKMHFNIIVYLFLLYILKELNLVLFKLFSH